MTLRSFSRGLPVVASMVGLAAAAPCVSTATAASTAPETTAPTDVARTSDLLPRTIAAGPPASFAWTEGSRVRVAAPGVPARTVAWLRSAPSSGTRSGGRPALSRDGSHLVVIGDQDASLVPITTGGRPVRIPADDAYGDAEARWSADGRTVLIVEGALARCTVEPVVRCTTVGRDLISEYGATISPDGASVAYVRTARRTDGVSAGDLVVRGPDGRGRILERTRVSGRRTSLPTPPTWTSSGLVWGVLDVRDIDDDAPGFSRVRTRILRPDGTVHTLSAGPIAGGRTVPFLPFGGAPDAVAFGARYRLAAGDVTRLDLATLAADGSTRQLGVSLTGLDGRSLAVLGVLADGRVAVREGGDGDEERLYLVPPGARSLGRAVARGSAVDVAAAFPNDARSF
ncbi:hypothetical protein [Patulibacter minatonensis]|uniref:hypothetical protein n=1 Tax=Patulibacter minatonensis TaxID=298163 RepID=UPI00047DAD6A|nr:hypothetical protein [Patulibacter minatonensis]